MCVCVRGHYEDVRATLLPHTVMFLYIFLFFLGCCRCGCVACYIDTHTHRDTHTVTHWDTLARHTNDLYECLPRSLTSSAVAFASSHTHTCRVTAHIAHTPCCSTRTESLYGGRNGTGRGGAVLPLLLLLQLASVIVNNIVHIIRIVILFCDCPRVATAAAAVAAVAAAVAIVVAVVTHFAAYFSAAI